MSDLNDMNPEFIAEIQKDFLEECTFLLEKCEESYLKLEKPEHRVEELGKIFRLAHSLKGAGASVGFTDLSAFAHVVEDCLSILRVRPELVTPEVISLLLKAGDAFKTRISLLKEKSTEPWDVTGLTAELKAMSQALGGPSGMPSGGATLASAASSESSREISRAPTPLPLRAQSSSVKVDTDRIEGVLEMVGELVVLKSQLMNETRDYGSNVKLTSLLSLMEKSVLELQDQALGMRMTPLKSLFLKTQRVVRDLSVKLKKPIEYQMSGEDTEIDRTMVELLADPLLHLARNALDHGIETPEARRAAGKPEQGTVHLVAQQLGSRVIVKLSDDGAGIQREKVLKKAVEKGLLPEGKSLDSIDDREAYQLIFAPGFSTAEMVTDVSGRGVGLDVVRTNVEKLRGSIDVETRPGQGTTFMISIPITTSITEGMQVMHAGSPYILPLDSIRELVDLDSDATTEIHTGQELLNVRGTLLPMVDLDKTLRFSCSETGQAQRSSQAKQVVVVQSSRGWVALRVERVLGQVQVVLKPLGDYFSKAPGIAGAAILGDGQVALVLDIDHLARDQAVAA